MALANNSAGVDAALKGLADLGKTIEPLAARLQALSDDADRLVKAIDAEKVRAIVDNVQAFRGRPIGADRADKLVADNSDAIDSTIANVSAFSKTLSDNRSNIDATLKGFADLGKRIEPLAQRLQSLSEDADKLVKAIEADKVRSVVDNANTFSKALAASSGDYQAVMRDGAASSKLNDPRSSSMRRSPTSQTRQGGRSEQGRRHRRFGQRRRGDSAPEPGNIDQTIKNATEMMAKLNDSADKIDGLITSAQGFLGPRGPRARCRSSATRRSRSRSSPTTSTSG